MAPKLILVACQNHALDVRAVIDQEQLTDVTAVFYPPHCGPCAPSWDLLADTINPVAEEGDRIHLLGGACLLKLADPPASLAHCRIQKQPMLCQHWYANPDLLDAKVQAGAYMITNGWLARWRHQLKELGLDQQTARALFSESAKLLLLLDTGTYPKSQHDLAELCAFVDVPHETLPVGLDYFRLFLMRIVLEWRSEESQAKAREVASDANRRSADHAIVLDVLSKLTKVQTEDEVVNGLMELFAMLFASGRMHYLFIVDGVPGKLCSHPTPADDPAGVREELAGVRDEASWDADSGVLTVRFSHGTDAVGILSIEELAGVRDEASWDADSGVLTVRFSHGTDAVGILSIEELGCPEHGQQYCNFVMEIQSVCGLAVTNARAYQRLADAHDQIRGQATDLERSNVELEQFAYVASHDLQEPLRMVTSYVQLLAQRYHGKLDEKADKYISYAVDGATRMQQLISDLLTFSRVGKQPKPHTAVPTSEIVDQTVADLEVAIQESRGVVTRADLPTVSADRGQMGQLFGNLIRNGLKFRTDEPPRIHVDAERNGQAWVFSVRDNGIGIDTEFSERIFRAFQRLHERNKYPGTGIGLAIAKKIVERHGGRIWIESEPGKGTTFFFHSRTQ